MSPPRNTLSGSAISSTHQPSRNPFRGRNRWTPLDLLRQNWPLKLISLLIAVLMWSVTRQAVDETLITILPLNFTRISPDLVFMGASVDSVRLTLVGSKAALSSLSPTELKSYEVDLANLSIEGQSTISLLPEKVQFGVPNGVRVLEVIPSAVDVQVDRKLRKDVPVRVMTAGKPPEGFHIRSLTPQFDTATVEGPRSSIEDLQYVVTQPVQLEGRTRSGGETVALLANRKRVSYVGLSTVVVSVDVEELTLERTFADVPLVYPPGYEPKHNTCSIAVSGPFTQVRGLGPSNFQARLASPPAGNTSRKAKLPVEVHGLPPSITVQAITPREVEVQLPAPSPTPVPAPAEQSPPAPDEPPLPEESQEP